MKWTTKRPSVTGFYFVAEYMTHGSDGWRISIVEVASSDSPLEVWMMGFTHHVPIENWLPNIELRWWGPIEQPDPPATEPG
jgi:hypothetical protein